MAMNARLQLSNRMRWAGELPETILKHIQDRGISDRGHQVAAADESSMPKDFTRFTAGVRFSAS